MALSSNPSIEKELKGRKYRTGIKSPIGSTE
jgi:hypothetical protein